MRTIMKVEEIVENLIKDIQDIQKSILRLKNSSEIPLIETDLILSKLRDIYESVYQLKNQEKPLVDQPEPKNGEAKDTEDTGSPEVGEEKPEVIQENAEMETHKTADAFDPTVLELETENKEEVKEQPEGEDADEKAVKTTAKTPEIVADRFKDSKEFRNESIAKTRQSEDLSTKLQSKPIKDIGSAIGINDRFLYIKELFDGNAEKFDATIKILNSAPNFNEAFNYLSENFSWDMDDPPVQKLLELTRRKHIVDADE